MPLRDIAPLLLARRVSDDMASALTLLSRLPAPQPARFRGAASGWVWPLVGGLVGVLAATTAALAAGIGLPVGVQAGIALAAQALMTGGLHEDGLSDSADGLWGGHTPARRLEIMKDSRVGSYGVLALSLTLVVRWSALCTAIAAGHLWPTLLAAGVLSRLPMVVLMAALPNARGAGLSQSVGRPGWGVVAGAGIAALTPVLLLWGWTGALMLAGVAVTTLALARVARARIGGQTGDILGASQQLAELAVLAICAR